MHSVQLQMMFDLRSSPEIAEISLWMMFLSSSRLYGFVVHIFCLKLLTNESHKVFNQGQCRGPNIVPNYVAMYALSYWFQMIPQFLLFAITDLHYKSSCLLLVMHVAVIQWLNSMPQLRYTVEQRTFQCSCNLNINLLENVTENLGASFQDSHFQVNKPGQ
jgi:hypothetical protein